MKILSIYPYTHISSAALMINGKVVAASPEERFNRIKMSTAFPVKAIEWCLKEAKLKLSNIPIHIMRILNEEPIVCSPNDAIGTFYSCGLDILVIGDYVVEK